MVLEIEKFDQVNERSCLSPSRYPDETEGRGQGLLSRRANEPLMDITIHKEHRALDSVVPRLPVFALGAPGSATHLIRGNMCARGGST